MLLTSFENSSHLVDCCLLEDALGNNKVIETQVRELLFSSMDRMSSIYFVKRENETFCKTIGQLLSNRFIKDRWSRMHPRRCLLFSFVPSFSWSLSCALWKSSNTLSHLIPDEFVSIQIVEIRDESEVLLVVNDQSAIRNYALHCCPHYICWLIITLDNGSGWCWEWHGRFFMCNPLRAIWVYFVTQSFDIYSIGRRMQGKIK